MKSLHALLVDDDTQTLETMGMILEMDNYQVSTAPSGSQALERLDKADENPPGIDFLVVDLDMDNLSGIELLIEMRKRGYALPVMVVTGYASKGTVVELLRQGVADFLDKPIHLEEFRTRVHRLAHEAMRRRKEIATPVDRTVSPSPFRSSTVLDLGRLGLPYAMRRRLDSAPESSLLLAARKPHGFDLLLAEVEGADAESFYVSVLVKTFFDRWRRDEIDGREFMATLNGVVLGGSLVPKAVHSLFLRANLKEGRIDAYPAGYTATCFLGLGGESPRGLVLDGEPLGLGSRPGQSMVQIPFESGERIFLIPRRAYGECTDAALAAARVGGAIVGVPDGTLEAVADRIWAEIVSPADPAPSTTLAAAIASGTAARSFLLGLEAP